MSTSTWFIAPRDPLVLGNGQPWYLMGADPPFHLPPNKTLAGMVRSSFVANPQRFSAAEAQELLKISLRGPFLATPKAEEPGFDVFLPPPGDVRWLKSDSSLVRGRPLETAPGEGFGWPQGAPDLRPILVPDQVAKGAGKEKTKPIEAPYWPIHDALAFALGTGFTPQDRHLKRRDDDGALLRGVTSTAQEGRIHVSIDPQTGTARDGQLFAIPGVRYSEEAGILVEIYDGRAYDAQGPSLPGGGTLTTLGGESRLVSRREVSGDPLGFGAFRKRYEDAIQETHRTGRLRGLRLQLLTPGDFNHGDSPNHGDKSFPWLPSWAVPGSVAPPDHLRGLDLEFKALYLSGFEAVSGWNYHRGGVPGKGGPSGGGPRRVRRLAKAGTVYLCTLGNGGPPDPRRLLEACNKLWLRPLEIGQADEASLLAAPGSDGQGLVLPGLWLEDAPAAAPHGGQP